MRLMWKLMSARRLAREVLDVFAESSGWPCFPDSCCFRGPLRTTARINAFDLKFPKMEHAHLAGCVGGSGTEADTLGSDVTHSHTRGLVLIVRSVLLGSCLHILSLSTAN